MLFFPNNKIFLICGVCCRDGYEYGGSTTREETRRTRPRPPNSDGWERRGPPAPLERQQQQRRRGQGRGRPDPLYDYEDVDGRQRRGGGRAVGGSAYDYDDGAAFGDAGRAGTGRGPSSNYVNDYDYDYDDYYYGDGNGDGDYDGDYAEGVPRSGSSGRSRGGGGGGSGQRSRRRAKKKPEISAAERYEREIFGAVPDGADGSANSRSWGGRDGDDGEDDGGKIWTGVGPDGPWPT